MVVVLQISCSSLGRYVGEGCRSGWPRRGGYRRIAESVLTVKCDRQTLVNQRHSGGEVQCKVPLHPNCHCCQPCRSTQSAVPINRSTSIERGRHHVFECPGRIDCKMMLVACLQRQLVRLWLWVGCSGFQLVGWISVGADWRVAPQVLFVNQL